MLGKCPQTPPTAANSVRSWSVLFKISFKFPSIPFGLGNGLETVRPCPPRTWVLRGRASRNQFPFGSWGIRIVWQSLPALARLSEWCSTPTALLISASALGVCRSKVAALDSRLWHFPHLCDFGLRQVGTGCLWYFCRRVKCHVLQKYLQYKPETKKKALLWNRYFSNLFDHHARTVLCQNSYRFSSTPKAVRCTDFTKVLLKCMTENINGW